MQESEACIRYTCVRATIALTGEFSFHRTEDILDNLFHSPTFGARAMRGQAEPADGTTGSHSRGEHVVGVQVVTALNLLGVKIGAVVLGLRKQATQ